MEIGKVVLRDRPVERMRSDSKLEPQPPSTPPTRRPTLKRRHSWRSNLRGAPIWKEPATVVPEAPAPKEAVPRQRQAKHRQVLNEAADYHKAATVIQRHWRNRPRGVALLRLINSEARRRHQRRPSFQTRAAVSEDLAKDKAQDPRTEGPSIWQMMQCRTILGEVLQDVRLATKTCKNLDRGLKGLWEGQQRKQAYRNKCAAIWSRIRPKIMAFVACNDLLDVQRRTEMHWEALRQLVATPKASEKKQEVQAHWDMVLGMLASASPNAECAAAAEVREVRDHFGMVAPVVCA
eukprot:CAMPEP_0181471010 /NCGR_PEP_ID=MMETSP1110-20121109/38853_1 /TAXON_ID=174948 /ORGANISM="Symbiodinium sp., Strain CCMP421" /LENGTH=291 /DNA_ID=CAMNT_0023596013 /DNA_START=55 /DNA_END=930 /DNA_ORIENTATION=+